MDRIASSTSAHSQNGVITKEDVREIVREEIATIVAKAIKEAQDANKEQWQQIARVLNRFEVLLAGSTELDNIGLLEKHKRNSEGLADTNRRLEAFINDQKLKEGVFDAKLRSWLRATIFYAGLVSGIIQLAALFWPKKP